VTLTPKLLLKQEKLDFLLALCELGNELQAAHKIGVDPFRALYTQRKDPEFGNLCKDALRIYACQLEAQADKLIMSQRKPSERLLVERLL
jgi:hypothetical protein